MSEVAGPDLKPLELLVVFLAGLSTLALAAAGGGEYDRLLRRLAIGGYAFAVLAALLYAALRPW